MTIGDGYTPPGRQDRSGHHGQGNHGQGNYGQGNYGQGNYGQGDHGDHGGHGGHGGHGRNDPQDDRDDDHGRHGERPHHKDVNWEVYDVPRIWQMVANEGNYEAQDLVWAFNKISQYVDDTRLRLTDASKSLALAWSGAPAADSAQALLLELTEAMVKDTTAYVTATRELDNVVMRLTESKQRIEPLYEQWLNLYNTTQNLGPYTEFVKQTGVYQNEVEHTNDAARDEMRRLESDLSGARITTTEDFVPSTGVPSSGDLQLAGLGPQAIDAAHGAGGAGGGGGLGRGLLSAGGMPPPASVVPGGGLGGVSPGSGIAGPVRPAMGGVIGGDAAATRPMGGGMMGGGAGAGGAGAGAGAGGGKADTQWETRHGVSPVIGAAPAPDPSTMGVDDSFDKKQRRK